MSPLQVGLSVAFGASCLYTVLGYPGKYGALTGRSRLFRFVGVVLLDLLLGLFLLGTFIDFRYHMSPRIAALRFIFYFSSCLFLALALLCIALLDWLEGIVALRRGQRTIVTDMMREEMEKAQDQTRTTEERDDGTPGPGSGP